MAMENVVDLSKALEVLITERVDFSHAITGQPDGIALHREQNANVGRTNFCHETLVIRNTQVSVGFHASSPDPLGWDQTNTIEWVLCSRDSGHRT